MLQPKKAFDRIAGAFLRVKMKIRIEWMDSQSSYDPHSFNVGLISFRAHQSFQITIIGTCNAMIPHNTKPRYRSYSQFKKHTCKCYPLAVRSFVRTRSIRINFVTQRTSHMNQRIWKRCTQTSHKLNLYKSHLALLWLWLLGYEVIMDCALCRLWLAAAFFSIFILKMTVFFPFIPLRL